MTEKEKSYAGLLYQPGDPELVADRAVTVKKLYEYNNLHPLDLEARQEAIRGLLGKSGGKLCRGAAAFLYIWLQYYGRQKFFHECKR